MSALTTFEDLKAKATGRQGARKRSLRRYFSLGRILFYLIVILPLLLSVLYFGFIASDRYVSESRFLVRSASTQDVSGLTSILRTFGISRADDDSYAVQSYILSRDALRDLMKTLPMETFLNRDGIDVFSKCYLPWSSRDFENLYQCYTDRVSAVREETTGISRLEVDLFTPDDSKQVADALLELGEQLANRMNRRAEYDAVSNAKEFMAQAEARLVDANKNLTDFRNQENMLDIQGGAAPTSSVIAGLTAELARTQAEIQQQTRVSPGNPGLASLKTKASVLQEQIQTERAKLTGSSDALSNQISDFEDLTLRKQIADQALSIASKAIDQARLEAKRQRIYIETVVTPNLPDQATQPRRLRIITTVLAVSLMLFVSIWMIMIGGREHLNHNDS
ncbi:hypothetical protein [Jiella avicenniae]|uniref:Capsular polysaccharide transport system permease protein n=1 Tax=Jiella avicenniae TaxID=2907202 RepID=A0A9X1T5S5_9HYPH|nr:hypothetical protein [Jiella avicenniae]MCE7029169.1 hypothetical protein [Jiella avicenniae]